MVPSPGFPTFDAVPRALGIDVRHLELRRQDGFRLDLRQLDGLLDERTALVLVNSPHNPTGATASEAELESLHGRLAGMGVRLVVDEVYHPVYHGETSRSSGRLPRATVLGDMSKALCLSGLRVGWIVERDPERRARFFDSRAFFTISNSPLCEALAAAALRSRAAILDVALHAAGRNLALTPATPGGR